MDLESGRVSGGGPTRRRAVDRLLVPRSALGRAFTAAIVGAAVLYPTYADESLWVGVGVAVTVFVLVHAASAAYRTVWLPGVMAAAACVQWVLAAWSDYSVPGRMVVPPGDYFRYAVLTTVAFVVGLYLPLWRARARRPEATPPVPDAARQDLEKTCIAMVIGGAFSQTVLMPIAPGSIRYAVFLVGALSLVGSLALLLMGARRWSLWALVAIGPIAIRSVVDLQFLDAILYVLCLACVAIYRFRPRRATILLLAAPALAIFLAISAFKAFSRDDIRKQEQTASERAQTTSSTLVGFASQPSLLFGATVMRRTIGRLNEGWITSRMLAWVPAAEPFAEGETIVGGARSALVPRLFNPGKFVAGGHEIIPRFTGIDLESATSMGLSVPGEMYANFGLTGAVVGTFLYALLVGYGYRALLRRAYAYIVWWAWGPFLFMSNLSPEQGFAENANHVAKSVLVMWAFVSLVPAWRRIPRRAASRRNAPPRPAGAAVAIAVPAGSEARTG